MADPPLMAARLARFWRRLWQRLRPAGTPAPGPAPQAPARGPRAPVTGPAAPAVAGGARRISLALQGGGSHGAFTWGVLDRLLAEPSLEIASISGTSAGALNAAVLASGLARGGREGARAALNAFWLDVSRAGAIFSPFPAGGSTADGATYRFDRLPGAEWIHGFFRAFSPYEFNPLGVNPLRDVAARHVDEAALRAGVPRLYITATSVHSGQARVFTGAELGMPALLASACLPYLFHAVEIDGEPYWDGGYSGNPALYPLIHDTPEQDLLLVRINPLTRPGTPRRSLDIMDRVSEITFNAGLIGELRAIAFVERMLAEHRLDPGRYRPLRLHMIADDAGLSPLGAASKLDTGLPFLERLHGLGRQAADRFLREHGAAIGTRSSLDIEADLLGPSRRPGAAAARLQS